MSDQSRVASATQTEGRPTESGGCSPLSGGCPPLSGGCQCGAVRYRIEGPLIDPHICHCRMCQKAVGNYFLSLAHTPKDNFILSRGEIRQFHSSTPFRRGFCERCGTPLTLDSPSSDVISLVLGALDDPGAFAPVNQYGTEARMPWFEELAALPGEATEANEIIDGVPLDQIQSSNHQHPDHDTDHWPPARTENESRS
jgi:hypothetical protein